MAMAKSFEYRTLAMSWGHGDSTENMETELNRLGKKGWELVGMTRDESPTDEHSEEVVLFVFKRGEK
jgi:hypothetical protein